MKKEKPELGYLDRNGNFHACYAWGHNDLAYDLVGDEHGDPDRYLLEKKGWMVLRGDPGIDKWMWFYLADRPAFPSQKQWDFVFDWCREKGKQFPPVMVDRLWEDFND